MAKRRHKKRHHGHHRRRHHGHHRRRHHRRRKGYVFTAARRRALEKAQRARRRKHGKHRRKRRHSRKHGRRRRHHRRHHHLRRDFHYRSIYDRIYAKLIARGRSPAVAARIAERAARMRVGHIRRHSERAIARAEREQQLKNLFAGLGDAARAKLVVG